MSERRAHLSSGPAGPEAPPSRRQSAGSTGRTHLDDLVARLGAEAVRQCRRRRFAVRKVVAENDVNILVDGGRGGNGLGQVRARGAVPVQARQYGEEEVGYAV